MKLKPFFIAFVCFVLSAISASAGWILARPGGAVVAELVGVIKDYAPGGQYYNPNDAATIDVYNQFTNRVQVSNYMADTVQDPPAN